MKLRVCALFATLVCASILPALAVKEMPERPPRHVVGGYEAVTVIPDLAGAESDGDVRVWRHQIFIPDAVFVRAHLINVNLRKGDELVLRSRTGKEVERIVGRGPKDMGTFWALSAFGDTLDLEFRFSGDYRWTPFRIDQVAVGDASMLESASGVFSDRFPRFSSPGPDLTERLEGGPESICQPPDFEDIICYQSDAGKWDSMFASVGLSNVGGSPGSLWCSGTNLDSQGRVLTNEHCVSNQNECNSTEFIFKYYHTTCGGSVITSDWEAIRCDTLLALSPLNGNCEANLSRLDFSLHSVMSDTSAYGHVEPDPVPLTSGEGIYIVQHPSGRPHEVTHGSGADVEVDGFNLRYYDTLDTEPGSSGSPIFREADDKLVGLHHCGGCSSPGVGNRGMLMSDIYPEIQPFLCQTAATITENGFQDVVEVSGNGDPVIDGGETWEFRPVVQNIACSEAATGVTGTMAVSAGSIPVTLTGASVSFGDVAAGDSAPSAAGVEFEVPAGQCDGSIILDLNSVDATNGGPFGDFPAVFEAVVGDWAPEVLVYEDFSEETERWAFAGWERKSPIDNIGMTVPFAMFDSNVTESGASGPLESPAVDASGYRDLELQFTHDFRWYEGGGDERGDVEVRSSATNGLWQTAASFSGGDFNGIERVDLSKFRGSDFQVRFVYSGGESEWWWAIDEIFVLGDSPEGDPCPLFDDGFESGDTSAWSDVIP